MDKLKNVVARACLADVAEKPLPRTPGEYVQRQVMLSQAIARTTGCTFGRVREVVRSTMLKTHPWADQPQDAAEDMVLGVG